jgi:hypothetical protein
MPEWIPWNTRRLIVRTLVTGRATQSHRSPAVEAADHERQVRVRVAALRWPLADRVTVEATRMLKYSTRLNEYRLGPLLRIADSGKRLRRLQILSANTRCGGAGETSNGAPIS